MVKSEGVHVYSTKVLCARPVLLCSLWAYCEVEASSIPYTRCSDTNHILHVVDSDKNLPAWELIPICWKASIRTEIQSIISSSSSQSLEQPQTISLRYNGPKAGPFGSYRVSSSGDRVGRRQISPATVAAPSAALQRHSLQERKGGRDEIQMLSSIAA